MPNRTYYVRCKTGCLAEALTKEQTLAAIKQAIETGEIKDVDTGFVTKITEQNSGAGLSFWVGTSAEYNAIETKEENCFYILTDDTTGDDLKKAIEELRADIDVIYKRKNPVYPEITVVPLFGGVVKLISENGEEIAGYTDGEKWVFEAPRFGDYTIKCTDGTTYHTEVITIDEVKKYSFTITYFGDNFADNSWSNIILAVENNAVPDTWVAGDTKKLAEDSEYIIRIIGRNQDTYTAGGTAPLTFAFAANEDYSNAPIKDAEMFEDEEATPDWRESKMRNTYLAEFLLTLPTEIQNAIKEVDKRCWVFDGSSTAKNAHDKLFLLSESEYLGREYNYAKADEFSPAYEYYANGNYERASEFKRMWTRSGYVESGITEYGVTLVTAKEGIVDRQDSEKTKLTVKQMAFPAFCF